MPPRPRPLYDGDRYDVADSVGHLVFHLMQHVRREVDRRMTEHDLTDAQWKPLWALLSGRAGTANELARLIECDAGAVTRTVDRLEAKGYVERLRSDTDRRVVRLRLTAAGEQAAQQIPHVLAGVNNDLLRGFDRDEWLQLRGFLERMLANGQALQGEPGETAP